MVFLLISVSNQGYTHFPHMIQRNSKLEDSKSEGSGPFVPSSRPLGLVPLARLAFTMLHLS